jgi:transposase
MDSKPEVRLSWKEAQRLQVLEEVRAGGRTQISAGRALGLSDRWIRTLLGRLKRRGAAGLAHGNRGRPPAHRIPESKRREIVELYRRKYEGFNLTHFREMLEEREGTKAPCREMLRRILEAAGAWERRREAPRHRLRRPRREREGELLQMDASIHRWFGEEEPLAALLGAIDDATGDVPVATFFPQETAEAYFQVLGGIVRFRGVPRALYTDRDSAFVVNLPKAQRELAGAQGRTPQTQLGRALTELGVEWIAAHSPQAKGRIERLWRTFQDRLLNELKLEGIRTLAEANEYLARRFLPRFNRQFRRQAACPESAYRPQPPRGVLESILCWKESRVLARDHTFTLEGQAWQVLPCNRVLALTGKRVEVRRTLRGQVQAWYGPVRLELRPAPACTRTVPLRAAAVANYPVRGKVRL